MSRTPDHEHDNDVEPLGFGDAAPVKREAPPLRIDKYDGHPDYDDPIKDVVEDDDDDVEVKPRKKKRKKKSNEAPKEKPDLLQRLEREPEPSWTRGPILLLSVGLGLCLIPLIVLVVKGSEDSAQSGLARGLLGGVLLFLAVLFQISVMASVLFVVGAFFGIDYGPIGRAFVKLAAIIAMVDGVGGGMGLALHAGCGSMGILMAVCLAFLLTYALIQTQFELAGFETMVTAMGIMAASVGFSVLAAYIYLSKMIKAAATAAGAA